MKRLALLLLTLTFALPAAAELYRWTDSQGHVHYSDSPPPRNIKKMERINTPYTEPEAPPEVGAPVTLYTGNCGPSCDQAADFLRQRGVPFTLKNADTDPAARKELKERTGELGIPILFVGEAMQRGYSPSVWDKMLEVAGYPAKPKQEVAPPQDAGK